MLDTNIIVDLLGSADTVQVDWSRRTFASIDRTGGMACNLIVLAEVAVGIAHVDDLLGDLDQLQLDVVPLTIEAAFAGGRAFREYRRRGGTRDRVLPDFLIAGHAEVLGAALMTRDRRLASYFPNLSFITPETHP